MRAFVVTPPAPVVTWEEADAHLRLEGDISQKPYVETLIAAATGHIDGPDGWLGRAIGVQTLEARFDWHEATSGELELPCRPIISLSAVSYLASGGELIVAHVADFDLIGAALAPTGTMPWTGGALRRDAVRIRYVAGYEVLPPAIRAAILLMVGDLYRFRESAVIGATAAVPTSATVEALLNPFRVYG